MLREKSERYYLACRERLFEAKDVYKWVKRYRLQGEEGLKIQASGRPGPKLPEPVRNKILAWLNEVLAFNILPTR